MMKLPHFMTVGLLCLRAYNTGTERWGVGEGAGCLDVCFRGQSYCRGGGGSDNIRYIPRADVC